MASDKKARKPRPVRKARRSQSEAIRQATRKQLELDKKGAEAFAFRLSGYTYAQIAEFMEAPLSTVHEWAARGKQLHLVDEAEHVFFHHRCRLEMMRAGAMQAAVNGDPQAIDSVLKIDKREAEILGLEPGKKVEVTVVDAKASLKAKIDQYMKRTGRTPVE